MGSSIYEVKQKGKLKGYCYSAANEGEHSVSISLPPNGERFVRIDSFAWRRGRRAYK